MNSVAFSPEGALIAVSRGLNVELVDRASNQTVRVLSGHLDAVTGVAYSPDGTQLATTSWDRTTRLWDASTGAWRATLLALEAGGFAVFLPDGSYKLVGDAGRSLWWAIKLCRFAPGELDPYDPTIRWLTADAPIPP